MTDDLERDLAAFWGEYGSSNGSAPSPFVDWPAFWAHDNDDPEWVVEDVLARGRGHSIYARHGTGKSEFVLWCALEAIKAGHVVVLLDYEMGEDDLRERLEDMGYGPESDLTRLRYLLLPILAALNSAKGAQELMEVVEAVEAEYPDRHIVVIIDTIGRAVAGEENSADTIKLFYQYAGMALKQHGFTWVRLDHSGKENERGARGSSAKGDDVDIIWQLKRTDDGCELLADKRRSSWVPESVSFDRTEEPALAYVRVPGSWPAGTAETAALLIDLDVPIAASTRVAARALKEAGEGRRRAVVVAAMRYRVNPAEPTKTTPGTTREPPGTAVPEDSGTTPTNPHNQGAEPPPEPLGTTLTDNMGQGVTPRRGVPQPSPGISEKDDEYVERMRSSRRGLFDTPPSPSGG